MTDDDRLGTLTVEGDRATMRFRRRLPHPIEAVWAALTDPARRRAWFGGMTIDPRAGGLVELMPENPPVPPDAKRVTGRILVWSPPAPAGDAGTRPRSAVFAHEWRQRIVDDGTVRYELAEDGDHTVLTLIHEGLSVRNAQGFIPGTHAFLDRLRASLDRGPIPDWGTQYAEVAPAYG